MANSQKKIVKISWIVSWVSRIDWCEGHWCSSTYMVVRLSDVSSKTAKKCILMITLVYSKRVSVHNNLLHNSVLVFWTKNGNQWNNHFGQINKTLHHSHSKYPVPKQKLVLGFFFNHNLAIEELEFPNGIFNLGSLCFIVSHDRSFARAQTH